MYSRRANLSSCELHESYFSEFWLGVLYESAADPDPTPTLFNEISLTRRRQAQISHPGFGRSFERVPTLGRGGHERQPRWKAPHGKRSGQVACFQALRGFPEGD